MNLSRRKLMMIAGAGFAACNSIEATKSETEPVVDFRNTEYKIHPIGHVHNKKNKPVQLEIYDRYQQGLHRLELCSHVMVLWWFHKNDEPRYRNVMRIHPRGNRENPLTGVFATRSPVRPNLIAVTTCKILSVKDNIVTIDKIDAFDGTPVLDLKSAGSRKEPLK